MINCLIIDNNKSSIELIKKVQIDFDEFSFVGIREDYDDSLNFILNYRPKIVFLNIDSRSINVLQFLFEVEKHLSEPICFVALSKSKEKAYDAFKFDFFDFLLIPLTELSIRKFFLKYKKKNLKEENETICLKSYKDYQYINTNEILFLKADNNTTDFYMIDGKVVGAYKTLKTFEKILPNSFLRIHKSYIINKKYISRINYSKSICVINELKIPFTRTFIDNVDMINNNLSNTSIVALN